MAVELAVRRLCALEAPQSWDLSKLVSSLTLALSNKVTTRFGYLTGRLQLLSERRKESF